MKKILFSFFTKVSLSLLLLGAAFTKSQAHGDADPMINILFQPDTLKLGDTGVLEIRADNWGQTTNIATNTLDIGISVGANAEILGVLDDSIHPNAFHWTVSLFVTGTGNYIHLHNTGGPVNVFADDAQTIYLSIKATAVSNPAMQIINGHIQYQLSALNAAQGNTSPYDDNGQTSVTVVANPLPVTLASFTANAVSGKCAAQLLWTTAEEKNFDHFTVQYSTNGADFTNAGNVKSNGRVMGSTYTYTMDQPVGKTYYRLKMVDKNDATAYSKVAVINTNCNSIGYNSQIIAAPNPTRGNTTISGLTAGQHVLVSDMLGHQIGKYPVTGTSLQLDMSNYAAGSYILSVVDASGQLVQPIKLEKID